MSQEREQKELQNLVSLMDQDKLEEFKAAVEANPTVLYLKTSKNLFLYQIACLFDKLDFVKFMDEKAKNELRELVDAEVLFLLFFLIFKFSFNFI